MCWKYWEIWFKKKREKIKRKYLFLYKSRIKMREIKEGEEVEMTWYFRRLFTVYIRAKKKRIIIKNKSIFLI
jgi:hypothetical protein